MDAVSRISRVRGKWMVVAISLSTTMALIASTSLQAMIPPKSDASKAVAESATTASPTVDRSGVSFEPSETISVRGRERVRTRKAVATVSHKSVAEIRGIPIPVADENALPKIKTNVDRFGDMGTSQMATSSPRTPLRFSVPPDFAEIAELKESGISPERRAHVRSIIERIRPNADPDTMDIWIEQFASMPDGNIEFLVSQSALLNGNSQLPSILGGGSESANGDSTLNMPQSLAGPTIQPATTSLSAAAVDVVSRNLSNVMTVGYREELELTTASASPVVGLKRLAVFHHGTGPSVVTGSPLHLAIQTSGAVFFHLADGRLTRNGMFSRLDDGSLGISEDDADVALEDSPVVHSLTSFRIQPDGTVFEDGKRVGVISIVAVPQPELLTTDDGVYFQTDADVKAATEVELQIGALELSNVDVPRNRYLQFANRP